MAIFPQHYWNSGDCLLIQFKNDRGNLSHCFIASLYILKCLLAGFPGSSAGKESAWSAGDLGLVPGLGRSPGQEKGYPLQYSGLENFMDCAVHGVTKSWTQLSHFHFKVTTSVPNPSNETTLQNVARRRTINRVY